MIKPSASISANNSADLQSPLRIVEFANANVKPESGKKLNYESFRYKDLNSSSKTKRIMVASNQKLKYIGTNYESEMSKITSSVLKVGVYNKNTRKIKLYDADFYHLKPVIKCQLDIKESIEKSWREKTEDLALAFGSKNRQKMVNSRLKYESSGTSIVTTISPQFIEAELTKTIAVETTQTADAIPPQNLSATSVDTVYNISDIISEEEFLALDSEADILISANRETIQAWKREKKYCAFIIHCLEIHFQRISLHNAKLLCYLDYMMCLVKKNYKDFKKKDPAPEIPQPFRKKLLGIYVVNRSMPPRMKDKLMANAMVLALTANNYHIDGTIWANSTQIPWKRLVLIAYALGCHVSEKRNQDTKVIELRLPLYKYEPQKRQKKFN